METSSIFASMDNSFAEAQANQGFGSQGWRPDDGDYQCIITAMTVDKTTLDEGWKGAPNQDAVKVQCHYTLADDPEATEDQDFKGEDLYLPSNMEALPENLQKRGRIAFDRVKGLIKGLTGREDYASMAVAFKEVEKVLEEPRVVKVHVYRQPDRDGKPRYFTDYIQELVS